MKAYDGNDTAEGKNDRLKVATYNVNSIRSRLHIIIPWLTRHKPDLFCMQETKVDDKEFPDREFKDAGYHIAYSGGKRYNGVAVASAEELDMVSFGFDDGGPADTDRVLYCIYSGIKLMNLYVPQGRSRDNEQFKYKLEWFDRIIRYLERHSSREDPVICCGDLNVARENIDVHDPKRLLGHVDFNPEVWKAFDRLTAWGFTDIFRIHHREERGLYTFFDYRVPRSLERGLGWRVDHILATGCLKDRSKDCYIDLDARRMEKPSDHTILVAEFAPI
ncbi:MAG: exodeoxyribonuclease III [Syntrophales bacterium]|nr:exodeoxyribonuclease III [Syntrophales bacterium]MDY0043807.1 exodeoxyribonuclease III [Syntrophales bacterium]